MPTEMRALRLCALSRGNHHLSGVQRGAHTFEHPLCPKAKPEIATEMMISPPTTSRSQIRSWDFKYVLKCVI